MKFIGDTIISHAPEEIFKALLTWLASEKIWRDAYHVATMWSNAVIKHPSSSDYDKFLPLIKAGEMLEAMGKFNDALDVYLQASEYLQQVPTRMDMLRNAGTMCVAVSYNEKSQLDVFSPHVWYFLSRSCVES